MVHGAMTRRGMNEFINNKVGVFRGFTINHINGNRSGSRVIPSVDSEIIELTALTKSGVFESQLVGVIEFFVQLLITTSQRKQVPLVTVLSSPDNTALSCFEQVCYKYRKL